MIFYLLLACTFSQSNTVAEAVPEVRFNDENLDGVPDADWQLFEDDDGDVYIYNENTLQFAGMGQLCGLNWDGSCLATTIIDDHWYKIHQDGRDLSQVTAEWKVTLPSSI